MWSLYLAICVTCYLITALSCVDIINKTERAGYEVCKTFTIKENFKLFLISLIPIFNVFVAVSFILFYKFITIEVMIDGEKVTLPLDKVLKK